MDQEPNHAAKPIKDASVESILSELVLGETLKQPGDTCPYSVLKERLGKNPQGTAYPFVMTARRRFERKHNCVLAAIPKEGIRWLTSEEVVVTKWDRDIGHTRRHSRNMFKRQKTTIGGEAEKALKPELLKRRNQNLAFAGVLTLMSKPKTERQIAEGADKSGRILAAVDALKYFKKEENETV